MLAAYREGWAASGGAAGAGEVQVKYTCYLAGDRAGALRRAEELERNYVAKMAAVVADWGGTRSSAYAGYEQLADKVRRYDFATAHRDDKVLAGTPDDVAEQLARIRERLGADITVSCVFNPGYLPFAEAEAAVRLFAEEVVPAVAGSRPSTANVGGV
jgi:alkanesulfonate monooxygenase SsuD/methylene tetrahydromethanopterin reductase-like flavin-dependent oxidoreductase (luciferase family)